MRRNLLILILLVATSFLFAQEKADSLFQAGDYEGAYQIYFEQSQAHPNSLVLKLNCGKSLCMGKRYGEAAELLDAIVNDYPQAAYCLYFAYFEQYYFDKARQAMEFYIERCVSGVADETPYNELVTKAKIGQQMTITDIAIIDSVKIEKSRFLEAYSFSSDLGTIEAHAKGTRYISNRQDRQVFPLQNGDNLDLYIAYRLGQEWPDTVHLSSVINSQSDENYPFMMADGITLYYASKANSLGGYDIFMSRYNGSQNDFTKPLNIGFPFNSPANDYMYLFDEQTNRGWFATDYGQKEDSVVVYHFYMVDETPQRKGDGIGRKMSQAKRYADLLEDEQILDNEQTAEPEQIYFIVNDDVIYTQIDEFVSDSAREYYLQAQQIERQLGENKALLEQLRGCYQSAEEKEALKNEILLLEQEIEKQEQEYKQYIFLVRKLENLTF